MTRTQPLPDRTNRADVLLGLLLVLTTLLVVLDGWAGVPYAIDVAAGLSAVITLLIALQVRWTRWVFALVGLGLAVAALVSEPGWLLEIDGALQKSAFIAAFFSALTTLRHAAETSPAIRKSGRFLAQQPPGRRYAALTVGGQLFAMLLNYGAIALLGSLATASAQDEPDSEIRAIRTRRMLLAIQRGFVSTLPWSPLAFAMAISTSMVPGSSWTGAVLPCLVSGVLLAGLGWGLDTAFKPRLSRPPPTPKPEGDWRLLLPLLLLLIILGVCVAAIHAGIGLRAVEIVMVVVPLMAVCWVMIQAPERPVRNLAARAKDYVACDLPGYRGELILLMMAGFIGTLGGQLLAPLVAGWGLDLSQVPGWVLLAAIVWLIPLTGQIGANPILSVSLLAPLLPAPALLDLSPNDYIVAITAGWALSGASSPYTATTLLIGSFGKVSAAHVGLRWNGTYTLLSAALLSLWVIVVAVT